MFKYPLKCSELFGYILFLFSVLYSEELMEKSESSHGNTSSPRSSLRREYTISTVAPSLTPAPRSSQWLCHTSMSFRYRTSAIGYHSNRTPLHRSLRHWSTLLVRAPTTPKQHRISPLHFIYNSTSTSIKSFATMADDKKTQQKTYHKKATGNALNTVKKHCKENELKLYGSCFW